MAVVVSREVHGGVDTMAWNLPTRFHDQHVWIPRLYEVEAKWPGPSTRGLGQCLACEQHGVA